MEYQDLQFRWDFLVADQGECDKGGECVRSTEAEVHIHNHVCETETAVPVRLRRSEGSGFKHRVCVMATGSTVRIETP